MTSQLSLEKTFLLSVWLEAIFYGFLFCIHGATLYLHFSPEYSRIGGRRERSTRVMIFISSTMFAVATLHLSLNAYRFVHGFSDKRLSPGGPAAYLGDLRLWDQIFKYTLFVTQVNLGSAAAVSMSFPTRKWLSFMDVSSEKIYRCWEHWNYDWKVGVFPTILLMASTAIAYLVCGTYPSINPTATIFTPQLLKRIISFYSLSVGLNAATSSLIVYRVWKVHANSAHYRLEKSIPFVGIFVESAALQVAFQLVLLLLYAAQIDAQYIILECITPVIGIAFCAITVRMKLHSASSNTTGTTAEVVGVTTTPSTHTPHIRPIGRTDLGPTGKRVRVFSVIEEIDEDLQSFKNESNPEIGHAL